MKVRLDQLLVVDIEATCWEGNPPADERSEIIEVGICPLDLARATPLPAESILVKPTKSKVGDFCHRLTTLTQEQVDGGVSFAKACAILRDKHRSRERVWASYGEYDRRKFETQCAESGVEYPFGSRHINVKTLLWVALGHHREVGMAKAMEQMGLALEGTHHRGGDDAWNIARMVAALLHKCRGSLSATVDVEPGSPLGGE